jgi:hypothetical protein
MTKKSRNRRKLLRSNKFIFNEQSTWMTLQEKLMREKFDKEAEELHFKEYHRWIEHIKNNL